MHRSSEGNVTLELRLLSFSTGQAHPLAEQPIIFIDKMILPLDRRSSEIEVVGDFLILFVSFLEQSKNQDIFLLVCWKTGVTHRVSVSRFQNSTAIVDTLCSARVARKGNL